MLTLQLIEKNDSKIIYDFFPEDRDQHGSIEVDPNNGSVSVIKNAENDELGNYARHAISKVIELYESGDYPSSATVAWY